MKYFVIFPILAGLMFSGLVVTEAYGSVVEISFDDMVHQSELIVIGTVTEIVPTFEAGTFGATKDQFFHDLTLNIDMTLSKDVSFTEVSFRIQKDRLLDGHTSGISTSQDFEVGERVLVFLTKSLDNDYWDGQYHVLGNHQGKYSLSDGQALGSHFNEISEDELISKIYEVKQENKIPKYSLDSSFTLSYNQTALVADQLYVTFSKVTEDSRCPSDVACIWQGMASVQLDFRNGKYNTQKILSVGEDPSSIVFDTYKLELLDVKPNPVSTKQIVESDYVITALVTKSGFITSPLKQTQSGIPFNEIQCKQNLVLIQKYDGSPACVTTETAWNLVDRKWATAKSLEDKIKIQEIAGAEILEFSFDNKDKSIILQLDSFSDGHLIITIPRDVLDSKIRDQDDDFFILIDGKEIDFSEIKDISKRTFTIPFENGSTKIEITVPTLI